MSELLAQKRELIWLLEEKQRRELRRKFFRMFPEEGPYARDFYQKHTDFFALGAEKKYRLFFGPNGCGKSEGCGAYETTCHLTGLYPEWWVGKRYNRPIQAWAAGDTSKTLRESLQPKLFGTTGMQGTGIIPGDLIGKIANKNTDTIDFALIQHVSGGWSKLVIKSYEEGRASFQASDVDWIWLDEEPPPEVYTECVQRFRGHTREGGLIITETPMYGVSEVFSWFVPAYSIDYNEEEYAQSGRGCIHCTWDDVPHITDDEKREKKLNTLAHELSARTEGLPDAGGAMVFGFPEDEFVIEPMRGGIPKWWPRICGLDIGWDHPTAAAWGAHDRDTDTLYIYSDYKMSRKLPSEHISALKARGLRIPIAIDPSAKKTDPVSGESAYLAYTDKKNGLRVRLANNAVDEGLRALYTRFANGKIKVVSTCTDWIKEYRNYRTDKRNQIIKVNDDLMDATRYLNMELAHATILTDVERHAPNMQENTFGIFG